MELLQSICPKTIESERERNSSVELVTRWTIELSRGFNSNKQGQDTL